MSQPSVICFYHKRCVDGTAAAAVVLKKYPEAKTFPLGFSSVGEDLVEALSLITPETLIIYVDNAMNLEQLVSLGNKIIVIDHHISEQARVEEIAKANKNVTFIFNIDESGATLAWQYFFPQEQVPILLSYIKDIDIWRNELLPESSYAHLALSGYRDKPEELKAMMLGDLTSYLSNGKILAEHIEREVERQIELEPVWVEVLDWEVLAYNVTNHQSKAGHLLSQKQNSAVILYTISGDSVRCSMRSNPGQSPTALEVAKALGGGGHDHSAGAGVARNYFFSLILD